MGADKYKRFKLGIQSMEYIVNEIPYIQMNIISNLTKINFLRNIINNLSIIHTFKNFIPYINLKINVNII